MSEIAEKPEITFGVRISKAEQNGLALFDVDVNTNDQT